MVFNTVTFSLFFSAFFLVYSFVVQSFSVRIRNALLLLASYFFYGSWDWRFLGLIVLSSAADYVLGLSIHQSDDPGKRKLFLRLSIFINLGILGFFKYFNFFVESLQELLALFSVELHPLSLQIILPVGISFYTFQTLSYTIDVYRRELKPTRDALAFFTFVAFFPQLVAGPIERAKSLLPQFHRHISNSYGRWVSGLRLVLWGLFKKVVIADSLGLLADVILANPSPYAGFTLWLGILFFAFQIYCDFSGYSDMAIGLARMLGFELMTNFQTPYFSASFREFWQRWHISLSTWFRDYVYIPLGGNRGSKGQTRLNLLLTFLLSGLWHGANFTFILWGFLHGVILAGEKWSKLQVPRPLAILGVFLTVSLLWLPFRAENMEHLGALITQLGHLAPFGTQFTEAILSVYSIQKALWLLGIFLLFIIAEAWMGKRNFDAAVKGFSRPVRWLIYFFLILAICMMVNLDVKPSFIYFQF